MIEEINIESEKRKTRRKIKKWTKNIVSMMILFAMGTLGVVNAQSLGYEVFYQGESLGYVQSTEVFQTAVARVEAEINACYGHDTIYFGDQFELVPAKIESPMDVEACMAALGQREHELYVDGALIILDGEEIGISFSFEEATRIIEVYRKNNEDEKVLECFKKTALLRETKDFSALTAELQTRAQAPSKLP